MDHFVNILNCRGLLSTISRHLLVLDGHKAHLTLEVVQKAKTNGIDMLTLPSYTSHGLQPLDIACFKPFKVAFRAYKNAWCKRNPEVKVRKEDLASWVSLGLKKALTPTNIKVGFRGNGIWPINLEAMNSKMGPSESFLPRSSAEVAQDVEIEAEIIEEGLPPPPTNPTHFYVDNEEEEHQEEHQKELLQEDAPIHNHISTCLRLPQENQPRQRVACEPIVDYSQSQILNSDSHVENLQSIAQRKRELCIERKRKKQQRKLTKHATELEKKKKRKTKERRAHEREAKKLANSPEAIAAQEEAKRKFKESWTTDACERAGQKLHDLINEGGIHSNQKGYLGKQPLACKRN